MTFAELNRRLCTKDPKKPVLVVSADAFKKLTDQVNQIKTWTIEMDKKIKKIEKEVSKGKTKEAVADLKVLEKEDKKRDKLVKVGKKAIKKKAKK